MNLNEVISFIANELKAFDSQKPTHKNFQSGIGPFGEPQIVKFIAGRFNHFGIKAQTKRTPDLVIHNDWLLEFKIVRPFGDNGKEAEDLSINLLHPYKGNVSLIGDGLKLAEFNSNLQKGLIVIGFEHESPRIDFYVLLDCFEKIAKEIIGLKIGPRIIEKRELLIHKEHQRLICIGWELLG